MTFLEKLGAIVAKNNSLLCIGLDSEFEKLPERIKNGPKPQATFNKALIYATHDLVCAYKPNLAFYEACGTAGIDDLKNTCDFLKAHYPEVPIIIDAKRADIGNTNEGYAKFIFDYLGADAITLHPYLGKEAIAPFLDRKDKGCIILCKTSNSGSGELQNLTLDTGNKSIKLYQFLAEKIAKEWNYNGNCGLVVGATYPDELKEVRAIVKNMPILIPGIGAQGGDIEKTVKAGKDADGKNAIINASRAVIFASSGMDYAIAARKEAENLKNTINKYR